MIRKNPEANHFLYFHNLDGLRFLAAILVVINHIEIFKSNTGISNISHIPFIGKMGEHAVTLFFVLSGFLITYLLLSEKEATQTIGIKNFYWRRILRIWPLYYLIIYGAFFLFPHVDLFYVPNFTDHIPEFYVLKSILYFGFVPNVAIVILTPVALAHHTWSIGVEEQFYLVWPVIVKYMKKLVIIFLAIIITYLSIKVITYAIWKFGYFTNDNVSRQLGFIVYRVVELTRIDSMAIGAIGAYLFINKQLPSKIIFAWYFQISLYIITVFLLINYPDMGVFTSEIFSILFILIILNLALNKNTILNLEFPVLKKMGRISYGIYMYHPIVIALVINIIGAYSINNIWMDNMIIYIAVIVITLLVSWISYRYVEKRFLGMKDRNIVGNLKESMSSSPTQQRNVIGSKMERVDK